MRLRFIGLGFFCIILLAACNNDAASQSLAEALPLDETRPTFVFFYTDG